MTEEKLCLILKEQNVIDVGTKRLMPFEIGKKRAQFTFIIRGFMIKCFQSVTIANLQYFERC